MGSLDSRLARSLDTIAPPRPGPDRWDAIVADAAEASRNGRRWLVPAIPAASLVIAAVLLTLAWPFASGPGGTIERAAAAIGNQPVLHVVFTQTAPNRPQLVSLSNGKPIQQILTTEIWFDAGRDLKKTVTRLNGTVIDELLETRAGGFSASGPRYTCAWIARHPREATAAGVSCRADLQNGSNPRDVPEQAPKVALALAGFVDRYQAALASGDAREIGRGVVDGRKVIWLRVTEAADTQLPGGQDVAVDASSFEPVLVRPSDKTTAPTRIDVVDTEPYDRATFTRPAVAYAPSVGQVVDRSVIAAASAPELLGGRAFWFGEKWGEFRLVATVREELITRYPPASGREPSRSVGVAFEYAHVADDGTTSDLSALIIRQSTRCEIAYRWNCTAYDPPDGTILTGPVGAASIFRGEGLYVSISDDSGHVSPVDLARALALLTEKG
jgi:hypothetical protein